MSKGDQSFGDVFGLVRQDHKHIAAIATHVHPISGSYHQVYRHCMSLHNGVTDCFNVKSLESMPSQDDLTTLKMCMQT